MSREKLAKWICLTIIFGLFIYVVFLFVNYFIDKNSMNKLSNIGYELIDNVSDYYINEQKDKSIDEYEIINGELNIADDFKTSALLPNDGKIKYSNKHVYLVLFDGKYCSYKRFNEGVMTSSKVLNYDECKNKADTCPSGQIFNEGNCDTISE